MVRKIHVQVEEIRHDGGPPPSKPQLRGAIAAVISNPYAGRHVEDITPMMEALKPLGIELTHRLVELLGGKDAVEAYGKASIIGTDGELEHGALWHVPGGYAMREVLGSAKAIVPSGWAALRRRTSEARTASADLIHATVLKGEQDGHQAS